MTLCKDDFEQKRLLKDCLHGKVCKNDPVFLHSHLCKDNASKDDCAKVTLCKDDPV